MAIFHSYVSLPEGSHFYGHFFKGKMMGHMMRIHWILMILDGLKGSPGRQFSEKPICDLMKSEAPSDRAVEVLDFGCGDGRYLRHAWKLLEHLWSFRPVAMLQYDFSWLRKCLFPQTVQYLSHFTSGWSLLDPLGTRQFLRSAEAFWSHKWQPQSSEMKRFLIFK